MAKVSLKVVVAGRTYPLSVNEDEADKVQKAAADINKAIKALQDNYAVKDMQDLLAMTALQLAVKEGKKSQEAPQTSVNTEVEKALQTLANELNALK